jgi:acyl-coenzyme A thioesterase PaaI-like protein
MGKENAMSDRSGPFWEVVQDGTPVPPAAVTLGLRFVDADVDNATIEVTFEATEDFTNPTANVVGAFQSAMLYETVGAALLATLEPDQFQSNRH